MPNVDNLKAKINDLEDELLCLELDSEHTQEGGEEQWHECVIELMESYDQLEAVRHD